MPINSSSRTARAYKTAGKRVVVKKRRSKRTGHHSNSGAQIAENRPMTARERLAASQGRGGGLRAAVKPVRVWKVNANGQLFQ